MDQLLDERLLAQEYRDQAAEFAPVSNTLAGVVSANPGSIAAQTRGSVDVTIDGVAPGDFVYLMPPDGLNAGLAYSGCQVTAVNTVRIYISNLTNGAIDDGANNWIFFWSDFT